MEPKKVHPVKHADGTETVRLYGTTVDVTNKKAFRLFKRDYRVVRPRANKADTIEVTNLNGDVIEVQAESAAKTKKTKQEQVTDESK